MNRVSTSPSSRAEFSSKISRISDLIRGLIVKKYGRKTVSRRASSGDHFVYSLPKTPEPPVFHVTLLSQGFLTNLPYSPEPPKVFWRFFRVSIDTEIPDPVKILPSERNKTTMRKIIQITNAGDQEKLRLHALCDDGTVWWLYETYDERHVPISVWRREEAIPQDAEPADKQVEELWK